MKTLLLAAFLLVSVSQCLAQVGTTCDTDEVTRMICQREYDLIDAMLRNDPAAVSKFYAEDFTLINYRGTKVDKRGVLDALRAGVLRFDSLGISELNVRHYDGTLIVTAKQRQVAREPGADERPHGKDVRYANVYVLRSGVWQLVFTQITPVLVRPAQ
jgi:hypothetical protein